MAMAVIVRQKRVDKTTTTVFSFLFFQRFFVSRSALNNAGSDGIRRRCTPPALQGLYMYFTAAIFTISGVSHCRRSLLTCPGPPTFIIH